MKEIIKWRKRLFGCVFELEKAGNVVGKLKENQWTNSGQGIWGNEKVNFRLKHGFLPKVDILDPLSGVKVGKIKFSAWCNKAILYVGEKQYTWRYKNLLGSRWEVKNQNGENIAYKGSIFSGSINATVKDEVVILAGLFIGNYFWNMTVVFTFILLMPILPIFFM